MGNVRRATCNVQLGRLPFKNSVFFYTFLAEKVAPRVDFAPPEIPKWLRNRTVEARPALRASKNGLREGFWKKHEKCMKNGPENH